VDGVEGSGGCGPQFFFRFKEDKPAIYPSTVSTVSTVFTIKYYLLSFIRIEKEYY
jgi:hypothetical protein